MEVDGTNQAGAYAVADVIRVVPMPDTNPVPAVQISIAVSTNGFLLHLTGLGGQACEIQRSDAITSAWSTIDTVYLSSGGVLDYEDQNPLQSRAFYRVRTP
jgi:hypothetical protein